MQTASSAIDADIDPAVRYARAAVALFDLADPRRLAILDVLSRRGPICLGVAIFEAGLGTEGALRDAAFLERSGLITVDRPTGRNLSEICTITPSGSRVAELVATWTDR